MGSMKKQTSSKMLDTSSSDSDEGEKDLNLRKRDEKSRKEENILVDEKIRKEEKLNKEEKVGHKEKRKSFDKEKQRRSEEYAKAKEAKLKIPSNDSKSKEQRHRSVSEHSDSMIMPELEPQVAPVAPVLHQPPPIKKSKELELKSHLLPAKDDNKKSKSKEEKKEERKKEQKSIKEFFLQKAKETSASSVDETNNGSKGAKPREEKDKQVAIENNFGANKEYLTAFESFLKKDKSPKSKGHASPSTLEAEKAKAEAKKSFVLLASTLHPKKVVREEMKAEEKKRKAEEKKRKDWEEKVKREEAEKRKLEEEERRGKKRKEREWEEQREREKEEQLKKEKSERKKKEKEEKKRQEKEKEALEKEVQRKEQISTDKRRLKVDLNKVKTDFEGKIPLPV